MNPVFVAAITSILRWALAIGAGYLVKAGIWTQGDATSYVAAAALAILSLAWSQRDKIVSRTQLLVALMPGMHTEQQVMAHIADKLPTPSLLTPANTSPGVPVGKP